MKYRVVSSADDWREYCGTSYVMRRVLCDDFSRLGGTVTDGDCRRVEIWNPANPRGDISPNAIVEIRADCVVFEDLGGNDRLMDAVVKLVEDWRSRYVIDDLRIERFE